MKKRVVMTFGTFDLFHPWHRFYLTEARKLWDYLITIVARDETVLRLKGKQPRERASLRIKHLQESDLVDDVILWSLTDYYAPILDKIPDVLCFGYDQRSFNNENLQVYLQKHGLNPEIIILPAFEPEKWKSSKLDNRK